MNLCKCGCGKQTQWTFIRGHRGRINKRKKSLPREIRYCLCGCGFSKEVIVTSVWKFKKGHSNRGRMLSSRMSREIRYCACGCMQTFECKINSKKRFVIGHNAKGVFNSNIGRKMSGETKIKMSINSKRKGVAPWNKGKKCPQLSKKGQNNPFYGKCHTDKTKLLISKKGIGRKVSKITRNKLSISLMGKNKKYKGRKKPVGFGAKVSKTLTGKKLSLERRGKISKSTSDNYINNKIKYKSKHFFSKKNNKQIWYRSSYELLAFQLLESMLTVIKYEIEPFSIEYDFESSIHHYVPDILVTYTDGQKQLIEVKANWALRGLQTQAKLEAGRQFAQENNMEWNIWTEDFLFKEDPLREEVI